MAATPSQIKTMSNNSITTLRRYGVPLFFLLKINAVAAQPKPEEVIVTGVKEQAAARAETARPVTELRGEELRRQVASTLGETLAQQPGINNASFGPGVGLPVIRGLSGVRVKVVEDDIGAWDASSLGPDHAGGIEAVLADRIRVVRGPAALTYGNGAIGGVVAVETQRIPNVLPQQSLQGFFEQRNELINLDHRSTSAIKLDGGAGIIAAHIDAFHREQNDTGIPDAAIDEAAISKQFGVAPKTNTKNHLGNTDAQAQGGAAGFAFIGETWTSGLSWSDLRNNYGIPLGAHVDAGHVHMPGGSITEAMHAVRIDMQQIRQDFRLGWSGDLRWLEAVKLRIGKIAYQHQELENGAAGTLFENDVTETRLEFIQPTVGVFSGNAGIQHIDRDFSATGAEAFVPLTKLNSTGIWLVENIDFDCWRGQLGARVERQRIEQQKPSQTLGGVTVMHTPIIHATYNLLVAADYALTNNLRLTAAFSRAQRAPDIQELMALGPHLATRTFDIGDSHLQQEHFNNFDLGLKWQLPSVAIEVHGFYNNARDFIYQENTGFFYDTDEQLIRINCVNLEECLPVQRYTQKDAIFNGYEIELRGTPLETEYGQLGITLFSDYVRGRLRNGDDIPRLPPLRAGLRLDHIVRRWHGDIEITHIAAQSHAGRNETTTAGYIDLDAGITYRLPLLATAETTVFLRGRNLLNSEIRNATSFLRSYAMEAGRSAEVGFNVQF